MRQTPLVDEHRASGGKLVDFHGWELPVQFEGIVHEHLHTRSHCTLFDCSHMGEFLVKGRAAIDHLRPLVISNMDAIRVGRGRYGAVLNDKAGIIDDIITIRLAEEEYYVVTNAASIDQIAALTEKGGIENVSDATAKIDVQGPQSREIMKTIGFEEAADLKYFNACRTQWRGKDVILTRMGYTGELGYEVYMPNDLAVPLWKELLAIENVEPAGLGARDTLRLEVGYPLSGQDFDETRTPLEAGQESFIEWDKEFVGRDVLLEQKESGVYPVLTGIVSESRRAPRHDYLVYAGDYEAVGTVTSGTFGPSVEHGIGLAYIGQESAKPGTHLAAGPKYMEVKTAQMPFYTEGTCRN